FVIKPVLATTVPFFHTPPARLLIVPALDWTLPSQVPALEMPGLALLVFVSTFPVQMPVAVLVIVPAPLLFTSALKLPLLDTVPELLSTSLTLPPTSTVIAPELLIPPAVASSLPPLKIWIVPKFVFGDGPVSVTMPLSLKVEPAPLLRF